MKILSYFAERFKFEYTEAMRLLGIDYGTKRVGIALSDEAGQFAMPLIVLANSKKSVELLKEVVDLARVNAGDGDRARRVEELQGRGEHNPRKKP